MNNIVVVIPCYSETSGGVKRMLRLAQQLHIHSYNVGLHIQKGMLKALLPINVTTGQRIIDLPNVKTIITYSDDPLINEYKQIENINLLVYMLSFGMAPEREKNVVESGAKILCSTQKIVDDIYSSLFLKPFKIGFSLDEQRSNFYLEDGYKREYLAIMYHSSESKNYKTAVEVCNEIDLPVIVFGQRPCEKINLPKRTESIYYNVNHATLRRIFNRSKLYLNTSLYEGLNLTPLEAMLCGCPSVLNNGANELYENVMFSGKSINNIISTCNLWIDNYALVNNKIIAEDARRTSEMHTWENVLSNLKGFL